MRSARSEPRLTDRFYRPGHPARRALISGMLMARSGLAAGVALAIYLAPEVYDRTVACV